MRLKIFFACMISTVVLASTANAATILQLILDPASEADTGIAPINGMVPTSSRVGAGNYHLYAVDDTAGSFGISSYNILVSNATTSLHRSPTTAWNDPDANGPFNAGFSLLRSSNNQAPIGTFQASQPLPGSVPALISNIGKTVGNFPDKITGEDPAAFALTTSGAWGDYAAALNLAPVNGNRWVLIGEGQYTAGTTPTIGSSAVVTYFNDQFASLLSDVTINPNCVGACGGTQNTPPNINDFEDPTLLNASDPGSYSVQMTAVDPEVPPQVLDWDGVSLISYTPDFGGTLGVDTMPTISDGGLFSWNTVGSGRGHYVFGVSVSDGAGGTDTTGRVTLHIGAVPEPATIALFGIAMVGGLGLVRRRNG